MVRRTRRSDNWHHADEESPIEEEFHNDSGFKIGSKITPVQRAICRAIDGYPLGKLWQYPDVREAFRAKPQTDWVRERKVPRPFEVVLAAGIRGGKTMIGAIAAVHRAVYSDLDWMTDAEGEPILPLLSIHKKNARAALNHMKKLLTHKGSKLGKYYVGETTETITVQNALRPEMKIEIVVTAGSRAATNLESYWLVSCVFDEAFKMLGRDDSTINLEDAQAAARERIVKDGQILYIGSPWAPDGPAYNMVRDNWGKPNSRILVVRATGPMLNPHRWDAERIERLRTSTSRIDRENYITSVLGQFLDPETSLIPNELVEACQRKAPDELGPVRGVEYVAAMDPATRHNAWSLMVGHSDGKRIIVDLAREWLPAANDPLDPEVVLRSIAIVLRSYKVSSVWTDQWALDALRPLAAQNGLRLNEHKGKDQWEFYDGLRVAVQTKRLELPPIESVRLDLTRIVKRPTGTGMRIILPVTGDGRHCDFAPCLALLLAHPPQPSQERVVIHDTDEDRLERQLAARDEDSLDETGDYL